MDVNDTKFHLLLGSQDWVPLLQNNNQNTNQQADSAETDLYWDEARATLSLSPLLFRFPTPPGDNLPQVEDRRGAAQDRYGNWYWIADHESEIYFLPQGGRRVEHFWSASDLASDKTAGQEEKGGDFGPITEPQPTDLSFRGLAVTAHHYLVVGVLEPAGLLIFDLHAGGAPTQLLWPAELPFAPFDMAPAPGGGLWILDRAINMLPDAEARYWALDRHFRVITSEQAEVTLEPAREDDFQPLGEEEAMGEGDLPPRGWRARTFPLGISLEMASPVEARYPLSIEALPDGSVLILDSPPELPYSVIRRYRFGQQLGADIPLENVLDQFLSLPPGSSAPLRIHDMAFVPDKSALEGQSISGTLYLVASDGNQAFAASLLAHEDENEDEDEDEETFSLQFLPRYLPMRLFSGKGVVASESAVYYDSQDYWLPLVEQPRPRYKTEASLETQPFDGKKPDCVWHRLFLDASIPPDTQVVVESRAANQRDLLTSMPWQAEPALYRRSRSEVPYHQPASEEAKREGSGTWELLFQQAQGRYLEVRLTVRGNGRRTPRLRALRLYYPRFSYLKEYLPAAYQYDQTSASFLERYLANMEGIYTVLEGHIAQAQSLFDVRSTANDYLDWLAEWWFGVALDPAWDESRRRLFLSHALPLFNQRGTRAGLIRAIRLAIDPCVDESLFREAAETRYSVRIIERFLTRGRLGTTPLSLPLSPHPREVGAYQVFLARRYGQVATLNQAYQLTGTNQYASFGQMTLPSEMPAGGTQREDWIDFASSLLPIRRHAHKFTVLVPIDLESNTQALQQRLSLVQRVVEIEKPAHTDFEVKPYWALFRVGEARLGTDTQLGLGNRFVALMVGQNALADGYLASEYPWNVSERMVAGRDQIGSEMVL